MKWFSENLSKWTAPFAKLSHWLINLFHKSKNGTADNDDGTPFSNIHHFFVLMLENRSFDHMLGFANVSKLYGLSGDESCPVDPSNPNSPKIKISNDSDVVTHPDPPHEFDYVRVQVTGSATGNYDKDSEIRNNGFIASYASSELHKPIDPTAVMKCLSPEKLPILTTLARQFAVCDQWFSSLPGPTWPNRFFVHAGTSGGLDDSPSSGESVDSLVLDGFDFPKGTIYSKLDSKGKKWRVYHGDDLPQVAAIHGMNLKLLENDEFRGYDFFEEDLNDKSIPYEPSYTFIEPNYGNALSSDTDVDFQDGNSQHPVDDVIHGEKLIKDVYEKIFNSPVGDKSCLIIMYDEHGGFFDHVPPPAAIPPNDTKQYNKKGFNFSRLGVRIPAVVISPYIAQKTIFSKTCDHTSVLATLRKRFGTDFLTEREKNAQSLESLFTLTSARTDMKNLLPDVYQEPRVHLLKAAIPAKVVDQKMDCHTAAFVHLALQLDVGMNPENKELAVARAQSIKTQDEAQKYIKEVQVKIKSKKIAARQGK